MHALLNYIGYLYYERMQKRVLIRYRWKEREEERWLFWLEKKLIALGFVVTLAPLNETLSENTSWDNLLQKIQKEYSIEEKNTYVIPHDPGCLTILKYLERLGAEGSEKTTLLLAGIPRTNTRNLLQTESSLPMVMSQSRELSLHAKLKELDTKLVVLYSMEKDLLPEASKKLEQSKKVFL